MRSREEIEKKLEETFTLAENAVAERIKIDLLLDIRGLLMWIRDDIMFQRVVREREAIVSLRLSSPIDSRSI